jgi:hypothetical protein
MRRTRCGASSGETSQEVELSRMQNHDTDLNMTAKGLESEAVGGFGITKISSCPAPLSAASGASTLTEGPHIATLAAKRAAP